MAETVARRNDGDPWTEEEVDQLRELAAGNPRRRHERQARPHRRRDPVQGRSREHLLVAAEPGSLR
jgi:hypothetical protein